MLQSAVADTSSTLKVFHSVATSKNLNRNGIYSIFVPLVIIITIMHAIC